MLVDRQWFLHLFNQIAKQVHNIQQIICNNQLQCIEMCILIVSRNFEDVYHKFRQGCWPPFLASLSEVNCQPSSVDGIMQQTPSS